MNNQRKKKKQDVPVSITACTATKQLLIFLSEQTLQILRKQDKVILKGILHKGEELYSYEKEGITKPVTITYFYNHGRRMWEK